MGYIQYIKWSDESVTYTNYNEPIEEIIDMMKYNIMNRKEVLTTWLENENGKQIAYFDKHIQLIKGEEELKKGTKEEVLDEIYYKVSTTRHDIEQVLELLEEEGYIEFKKEPKKYKVFVKNVTIGEEDKWLYYVSQYHLTENIDEAKRFELDEDKDGYAYKYVKEY